MGEIRLCNLIIKFLLFLTNIILWLLGIIFLGIGIYVQVETAFQDLNLDAVLTNPAIALIIIGVVLFIVGFCGCFGALLELFVLLIIYAVILTIILFAEVGLVVYVFVQQEEAFSAFRDLLETYIVNYYNDINLRNILDFIQGQLFQCCGIESPRDWEANVYFNCSSPAFQRCSVPFSCCQLTDGEVINVQCGYGTLDSSSSNFMMGIFTTGCFDAVQGLIQGNLYVVGGVGVGLLVFQILNILLAAGLAVDVYREGKEIRSLKTREKEEKKAGRARQQQFQEKVNMFPYYATLLVWHLSHYTTLDCYDEHYLETPLTQLQDLGDMTHVARIAYDEGHMYDGQWNKDGKRDGKGLLSLKDGTKYCGEFVNGFYQGHGILSYPDGSMYEGTFDVGKYNGHGVYTNKDGMLYEGQFKAGECNGLGLITLPDGSHGNPRCEGVFRGEVCERRCDASDAVRKAKQAQRIARTIASKVSSN